VSFTINLGLAFHELRGFDTTGTALALGRER
jgi:hypothetical protein